MVDAGIGRLLIASLHQGIADVSPTRLEFYENWLSPTGLRDGRMGLAPLGAVLSFLQRETAPLDRDIPARAGVCAAEWMHEGRSATRHAFTCRMPVAWRSRAALGIARTLVIQTIGQSRVKTRLRRGQATVEIRSPLFDYLREPAAVPMRRFYAAAYEECLRLCNVDGDVGLDEEAPACRMTIVVRGVPPAAAPAVLDLR